MNRRIAIFSDLDGCLLNKADYSFAPAVPTLERIRRLGIPLVLASSKTEPEMRRLAAEMELHDAPLICENGGIVFWSIAGDSDSENSKLLLGTDRKAILKTLQDLRQTFAFESFEDLGVAGVMKATDLPQDRAEAAVRRSCTEPLLWHDDEARIPEFRSRIEEANLTLTRGGRFWHVAGKTDKGVAMQKVVDRMNQDAQPTVVSIAIGDSPIDQGMLDIADFPIGIPAPDGVVHVRVKVQNGVLATLPGAAGWADTVSRVLDGLECD